VKFALRHLFVVIREHWRHLTGRCPICGQKVDSYWVQSMMQACHMMMRECKRCNTRWTTGKTRELERAETEEE